MSRGLGAMVWPYPQRVYYSQLSRHLVWTASLLQLLLVAIALHQWRRGRCGLVIGLAFFYIGLLPVTRFLGFFDGIPPLAERFLYFPSVSLAFLAAIGLRFIARRYGMMIAVAPVLVVSIVFTPLCWTRNAEWADEVVLFEAEYRRGVRGSRLLEGLTSALMTQGKHDRVKEICGLHLEEFGPQEEYGRRRGKFALGCAEMLTRQRQFEEAERAFFMALEDHYIRPQAHNNLGIFYLRVGRREEARQQLLLAVEAERDPAMRSVLAGRMILAMNGYNLESMLEARRKFEEALRLRPRLVPARQWLARVNQRLDDS
jgi:tetratricopeptide (TPR) repeat protein